MYQTGRHTTHIYKHVLYISIFMIICNMHIHNDVCVGKKKKEELSLSEDSLPHRTVVNSV